MEQTRPRRLGLEDLNACIDLGMNRGWAPETEKWKLLLTVGGGWGIDDPNGGLAAVVTLIRFDPGVAVIGMMAVRDTRSRTGLGRKLMEHALSEAQPATVFLFATPMGRPLYEQLGFCPSGTVMRHFGRWTGGESGLDGAVPFVGAKQLDRAIALDRDAFGAGRRDWLTTLAAKAERTAAVEQNGELRGFGIAWRNADRIQLGPIIAVDQDTAKTIVSALAPGHDLPLRLDLAGQSAELSPWLQECGFEAFPPDPQMTLGGVPLPGDRDRIVALACGATG